MRGLRSTPPLLERMNQREIGELVVWRDRIIEPKTGCRVAFGFPSEVAAINAALRMNEVADWFGLLKARAEGHRPNCQDELKRIAEEFGGKIAEGAEGMGVESLCAKAVARFDKS
jgi:hypothetical protein